MEIHQLRYFLAVARTCNFSRAAEQCRVAQPSLSQQIMKLEDELGERLFERTKRVVSLTPAGERLREHAERVMDDLEQARASVCEDGGVVRGRVSLGVLPTVAPFYLPERLKRFAVDYPEVEVVLHEDTTSQLVRALLAKEIDVALVSLPVEQRGLMSVSLFEEPLLAALPAGHVLAKKRKITLRDLENEPFILMQEGHCLSGQALAFCRMEGFAPKVSFRSAQIETMRAFVAAGWGVSVVPQMAVQGAAGDGGAVCYRALGGMSREIGFIFNEQRTLSRAGTALLEFFKPRSRSAATKL
jgi:LysR family transcriptional regulator, hydrogen peroxide-inducible genes activator